jgi:long-chain acyl-CoA synthetase
MLDKVKGSEKPWLDHYMLGPYRLKKSLEPYPKMPVYQFLDDSADRYPGQTAVEYLGRRIKYEELRLYVNKLANALARLGVKKGDRVATILPNCPQFIITDFAVSKAGGVLVPCSTLHKVLDLEYEIGESGAETVVCSDEAFELVNSVRDKTKIKNIIVTSPMEYSAEGAEVMEVPGAYQFRDLIATHEPNPPQVDIDPVEDLAYLSFTGGATGVPKGVMITHYNRACNIHQSLWPFQPLWPGIRGKAASEIVVPLFHSYGHLAMQGSIAFGLRILLVSDPRDTDQIVSLMKEHRPLVVYVVPTHLMRIGEKKIGRLPVMLMSGAAPLPKGVFDAVKEDIMMPVTEGYGLTECGPMTHGNLTCFSKITGLAAEETLGIGLPVPDTEVKMMDLASGEEVGVGESGEIWIRGPQTMKGYWPTPGSGLDEEGWLHTGDVGRMDERGYFVLEDRIKDMANVSGYKVYTTEVDQVLFKYPGVAMAAAVGIPDPERPGSERIKVFIKPTEEYRGKITADEIIEYCKEKLAPIAVPKQVEFRDDLPLTVTEKIYKKALRDEEIWKAKAVAERRTEIGAREEKLKFGFKEGEMIPYLTPEWIDDMAKRFRANPDNAEKTFKDMTIFLTFRIQADPAFGLEKDIYMAAHMKDGVLQDDSTHLSKEEAEKKSDFILSAPIPTWKKVIQKEEGFVADFMGGKIKLDQGDAPKMIQLGTKAPAVVEAFNQVVTEWPDEMSPERLEEYRAQLNKYRAEQGI